MKGISVGLEQIPNFTAVYYKSKWICHNTLLIILQTILRI